MLLFSTTPQVSPVFLAARAKGRLQYALKTVSHERVRFSRKLAVRSIGSTTRDKVEAYISRQIRAEEFVDKRFSESLGEFTRTNSDIDLGIPSESTSGRYWYNLHLVLVIDSRFRFGSKRHFSLLLDATIESFKARGCAWSIISILPDHLHVAVRGNIQLSPETIAIGLQNDTAAAINQGMIWSHSYYVGTFGEYGMKAIRCSS